MMMHIDKDGDGVITPSEAYDLPSRNRQQPPGSLQPRAAASAWQLLGPALIGCTRARSEERPVRRRSPWGLGACSASPRPRPPRPSRPVPPCTRGRREQRALLPLAPPAAQPAASQPPRASDAADTTTRAALAQYPLRAIHTSQLLSASSSSSSGAGSISEESLQLAALCRINARLNGTRQDIVDADRPAERTVGLVDPITLLQRTLLEQKDTVSVCHSV